MFDHSLPRSTTERFKVWTITLIYTVLVVLLSCSHEVWRDEVATLSLVTQSHSLPELLGRLNYYGHPGLWHVLLYVGHHIFADPAILKIVNLLVCVSAIYLFLRKAPFLWGQKVLFVFGFFPLYLYPVFSRNYAVSMLLIFAAAALYKDRWFKSITLGVVLGLLANTHMHSFIIAAAVGMALLAEWFSLKVYKNISADKQREVFLGAGIWALGLGLSVLQIIPASDAIMFSGKHWVPFDVFKAGVKAVAAPGTYFHGIMGIDSAFLVSGIVFSLYAYLWRKKFLLIMFAAGVIGLAMFAKLIFPSDAIRHQGTLYLLMVMVLWMEAVDNCEPAVRKGSQRWSKDTVFFRKAFVTLLLAVQVGMAFPAVKEEFFKPYSSAQALARMVAQDPSLHKAIFVGVPDSYLETLPYYLDNPLYFFSEERFGKYRELKLNGRLRFSLTDVLDTSRRLQAQFSQPVIIILSHKVTDLGPFSFPMNYKKTFTYSPDELKKFYDSTVLYADLGGAIGDENYRVFLLKP